MPSSWAPHLFCAFISDGLLIQIPAASRRSAGNARHSFLVINELIAAIPGRRSVHRRNSCSVRDQFHDSGLLPTLPSRTVISHRKFIDSYAPPTRQIYLCCSVASQNVSGFCFTPTYRRYGSAVPGLNSFGCRYPDKTFKQSPQRRHFSCRGCVTPVRCYFH